MKNNEPMYPEDFPEPVRKANPNLKELCNRRNKNNNLVFRIDKTNKIHIVDNTPIDYKRLNNQLRSIHN